MLETNLQHNDEPKPIVIIPVFPLSHCPETKYIGDHQNILHHTYQHSIMHHLVELLGCLDDHYHVVLSCVRAP